MASTKYLLPMATHIGVLLIGAFAMHTGIGNPFPIEEEASTRCAMGTAGATRITLDDSAPRRAPVTPWPSVSLQFAQHEASTNSRTSALGASPPLGTSEHVQRTYPESVRESVLELAARDSVAALTWLMSDHVDARRLKHRPYERRDLIRQVILNMSPHAFGDALNKIVASNDESAIVEAIDAATLGTSPKLLRQAVLMDLGSYGLGDQLTEQVMTKLLSSWATEDPEGAKAWALSNSQDPAVRDVAIVAVAEAVLIANGQSAVDWAILELSGESRPHAVEHLTSLWMEHDPDAAVSWLQSLAPSAEKDLAIRGIVPRLHERDPEACRRAFESGHLCALNFDQGL